MFFYLLVYAIIVSFKQTPILSWYLGFSYGLLICVQEKSQSFIS